MMSIVVANAFKKYKNTTLVGNEKPVVLTNGSLRLGLRLAANHWRDLHTEPGSVYM